MITTENFFETGATLHHDAPSYIERAADQELQAALLRGEFCYVLTSRQMGKSSLLVRTASRLRQQGVQVVTIDLTAIGQNLGPQQWYDGLSLPVGYQLHLEDQLEDFMARNDWLGPAQRLFTALREVVLKVCPGPVIFFIDEIDTVCSLPFSTDEFFAAVRECYNRRVEDPAFNRITFALFGVATPSELIRDSRVTPFNIGRRIELNDFTEAEAARFAEGLSHQSNLIERVYHWSHGHPYLTQRLCQGIVSDRTILTPGDVDRLSEDLFLSNRARERDPNLVFVREKILRAPHDLAAILKLYKRIRHQERVYDDENNPLINVLRLSGITRVEKNLLVVRNRIYYRVFDRDWVRAHLPQAPETNTIAVLPFVDLSPERTHEYLADGLADELISALGKCPGLKVASRTSAFQFKGKNEDIQKIGNQLMVQHLVEGSIRVAGSTLQLSVRAIQAAEGHCLWQNTFKYSMTELERAAEDVARDIIRQLQGGAGESPDTTPAIRFREDAGVYNLYLQGRFFWNKRTEPALQRSINLFEEAVRKDPHNALAYSGLADAYNILGIYNYLRPADAYPKAKAAAVQALEWDDNLAQAHCALGCTSAVYDWDWRRAEHEFLRAIELNPSYAVAHQWYAINCLTPLGRHDEAVAALHRAYEVDPLSIHITTSIALTLYFAGAYDEALRQCRHVVDLEPGFWLTYLFLGWTCAQTRQFEEALGAFQNAVTFSGRDPVALAGLSYGYAVAGKPAEARAIIEELLHGSPAGLIPAIELVILYAALGEVEPAMQWLERACDERSVKMIYLKVDPKLSPLRCHPGFASYLTRIGVQSDSYED